MPNEQNEISFADAIRDGTAEAMREDDSVILYGLGVNDPGRVFGTTAGLVEEFGPSRVFETPTAENAMTGIAVGAAVGGLKTIVTHQRFDFFLLAMDQVVNSAAKWRYMFGGQFTVPVVFRLITGRGWGQGPTHSQSYHSWLAAVPGLKVVMPSTATAAKSLLKASVRDPNPVIFIEHRWLHTTKAIPNAADGSYGLCKARTVREGQSITIVTFGYGVIESLSAARELSQSGIDCEIIDLQTLAPFDSEAVVGSVNKTGRMLVVDLAPETGAFGSSVLAQVQRAAKADVKPYMRLLAGKDLPEPTSYGATAGFHLSAVAIFNAVTELLGLGWDRRPELGKKYHDVPSKGNLGPF